MKTNNINGGCKLKTPYGDLIVNDKGEVYQNGKQLTQSDEMYDSDTINNISFIDNSFINGFHCNNEHKSR